MKIELFDYQKKAIEKLGSGSILCGGVGSGKSRTSLAYYYLKENNKNLYIITTARKRDTLDWEKELIPFNLSTKKELNNKNISVIIDSWNNIKKYISIENSFFIFDEQRVVGSGTWVKSFLKITKNNNWILLSATPGDTWMDYVPVFIANNFYKNRTEFIRKHVVYNNFSKYPKIDHYIECGILIKLKNKILVTMEYFKKTKSIYKTIYTDYNKELYETALKKRWNIYKNEPIQTITDLFLILRKIVNSDYSRIQNLNNLLITHKKIIVFYNFNYELEILKYFCLQNNISFSEWNGFKHEMIPKTNSWLYLVQYIAGAEGWNCIETNTIVFYSQTYSYKIKTQAAGRIDRLNTPYNTLYYYDFVSKSKIDLAIASSLSKKQNFNEKIFEKKEFA